ncbi:unnamed protein product [Gordionus sp. m RMFG-2023]|uniref:dihydropteridine reductase-like n=1 Tax=Gordionus sp. m RMFG-2023 TaxID=3053472 RepID=UPI0030E4402A
MNDILILGGNGALGSICVKYFKSKLWRITSICTKSNEFADKSIILPPNDPKYSSLESQYEKIDHEIQEMKQNKFDCILNVAGGWCGGNAESKDFIKNCDMSLKHSVWTSCIAAHLASKYMKDGGLLLLTGAKASLQPTPGMIAYGMAKSCINNLTLSLSKKDGGLPNNSTVLALLPVILDTPMNRKWMPDSDFSSWTPLNEVAEKIFQWCTKEESRPKNGSLIQIVTKDNITKFTPVDK